MRLPPATGLFSYLIVILILPVSSISISEPETANTVTLLISSNITDTIMANAGYILFDIIVVPPYLCFFHFAFIFNAKLRLHCLVYVSLLLLSMYFTFVVYYMFHTFVLSTVVYFIFLFCYFIYAFHIYFSFVIIYVFLISFSFYIFSFAILYNSRFNYLT